MAGAIRRELPLLVLVALLGAAGGCREPSPPPAAPRAATDAAPAEPALPADALGRAGPVVLDVAGFREAIVEARILQRWRTGEPAPMEALENPMLRRRVLTGALETRLVRREAIRRGLAVPPERLRQALENFAAGRPLDAPLPDPPPDPETLDARLAARYEAPPARVRQVVADLLLSGLLANALLDEVDEETLRRAWEDEETRARVDVVLVPRVPTSREIDRAVRRRAAEIARFYEEHVSRFRRPERVVARRVLIVVPDDADEATRSAARAQAEALRARVEAGEDLAAIARAHTIRRERRRGGLVGPWTRERAPELFDYPQGALSPVLPHRRGWTFFRVESRIPASVRRLDDPTVQREIAAELLRRDDDLPHARSVADRVRRLLLAEPGGARLRALMEKERLRRHATPPFSRAGHKVVPGLGLAPELFDAIFRLTEQAPVTPIFRVRQVYAVARRVELVSPDPARWPEVRATFTRRWRERERRFVVERWLSERLRGEPRWVDTERLNALTLEELGAPPAAEP